MKFLKNSFFSPGDVEVGGWHPPPAALAGALVPVPHLHRHLLLATARVALHLLQLYLVLNTGNSEIHRNNDTRKLHCKSRKPSQISATKLNFLFN
jgi:hypothetical protein